MNTLTREQMQAHLSLSGWEPWNENVPIHVEQYGTVARIRNDINDLWVIRNYPHMRSYRVLGKCPAWKEVSDECFWQIALYIAEKGLT